MKIEATGLGGKTVAARTVTFEDGKLSGDRMFLDAMQRKADEYGSRVIRRVVVGEGTLGAEQHLSDPWTVMILAGAVAHGVEPQDGVIAPDVELKPDGSIVSKFLRITDPPEVSEEDRAPTGLVY
jgi:hypothetical protein